eukprot:TRINITY_DN2277_c1_g1_i9.p3 TRINITY_DN2277_c1_g1~~TRINITY_DN2277_c1_g1_i9.p3  ORF type:complete len:268 (-),score=18.84 TRINITY_DN2277_c1_g1_i9:748-1551(-)
MGVFDEIIAPVIGTILATIMFGSPLPAVLKVRAAQDLKELNPLPFPIIAVNCIGWVAYGVITQDFFLYFANMPGALLGVFYTLSCVLWAPKRQQDLIMLVFLIFAFIFGTELFTLSIVEASKSAVEFAIGLTNNIVLTIYYAAPLSVLYKVIVTRNAASLYLPLLLANTVNGSMWFVYGLIGLQDPMIWIGNGMGVIFGVISIILKITFPSNLPNVKNQLESQTSALEFLGAATESGISEKLDKFSDTNQSNSQEADATKDKIQQSV